MSTQHPSVQAMVQQLMAALVGLAYVLFLNGALPFVQLPTLGQAFWTLGFAKSFANEAMLTVHATNFGAPMPAPMAFGLAGAWLAGFFIFVGLPHAAAYSLMAAFYLGLSYWASYALARGLGGSNLVALLGAIAWTTQPIVMEHAGYSMLSYGIALLPFYLLVALKLFLLVDDRWDRDMHYLPIGVSLLYLIATILAIFMDGYTFMMFFVVATIAGLVQLFPLTTNRTIYVARFGVHIAAFVIAYLLYSAFIGKWEFASATLDFFRGWGADISFFLTPTSQRLLLPELLGWGTVRSGSQFFGDASTWRTTFSLPVISGAVIAYFMTNNSRLKTILVIGALFGFYMSLGPSVKFYSFKPEGWHSSGMKAEHALWPTGSSWINLYLPGFNNMRASYRWAALGVFGLWVLILMAATRPKRPEFRWITASLLTLLILFNIPTPHNITAKTLNYAQFQELSTALLPSFQKSLNPGERVAFLPWRNDFLVNYIAAQTDIHAYNIGGDKNYAMAQVYWPEAMKNSPMGRIDASLANSTLHLLATGAADTVIFPYIDMLRAAHKWPYPIEFEKDLSPIEEALSSSDIVTVEKHQFYSIVRLQHDALEQGTAALIARINALSLQRRLLTKMLPSYSIGTKLHFAEDANGSPYLFSNWSSPEPWGVWSLGETSSIFLPLDTRVQGPMILEIGFHTYATEPNDCPFVAVAVNGEISFEQKMCGGHSGVDEGYLSIIVPQVSLEKSDELIIAFSTPDAKSPASVSDSGDERQLGVAMKSLRFRTP